MQKLFKLTLLTLLALGFSANFTNAFADCQALYGGGQSCPPSYAYTINKLVQVPGKGGGQFVDNLSINDAKYTPSQGIIYQVIVTNTGSNTIPSLNVTDTFPQFITFVSGVGNYNQNTNTLNFTVTNLNPGKSVTYVLNAKTADANTMPSDQGIVCVVNQINATDQNGQTQSDSSQACIQKNVLAATQPVLTAPKMVASPATGPEMLPLALLLPGAVGGMFLRKRSKKMNSNLKGGE